MATGSSNPYMNFGKIILRHYPSSTNLSFRHNYIATMNIQQQCLLDNIWIAKNPHEKLQTLHALAFYFNQVNNQVNSNNFAFYLVITGRQPGIYNYWPRVLDQIINFPNLKFQGFYYLEQALTEASRQQIKYIDFPLQTYAYTSTSQSRIQFCEHCETMSSTFKNLNAKIDKLIVENSDLKTQFIKQKLNFSVPKEQQLPLKYMSLPEEIKIKIKQQIKNSALQKQLFIMRFLTNLAAINDITIGLTFI